jgi:hypothetical protein
MSKLVPAIGGASGGYTVTIHGAELANTETVQFGTNLTQDLQATDTTVTCTAPAGPIGEVEVTCLDKYGNKSNSLKFMYEDS